MAFSRRWPDEMTWPSPETSLSAQGLSAQPLRVVSMRKINWMRLLFRLLSKIKMGAAQASVVFQMFRTQVCSVDPSKPCETDGLFTWNSVKLNAFTT